MKAARLLMTLLMTLLISKPAAKAWGPDGHHLVARLAAMGLPEEMPAFFRREVRRLEYLNYEPDSWRDSEEEKLSPALRRGHDPDHHFLFELFDAPELPPDRYSFVKVLDHEGKDPAQVGVLPYRAMELFQRMRVAFRQWRAAPDPQTKAFLEARIMDDAGILGHYVADASQPLHVTVNNNGWVMAENPENFNREKTLHLRFEADFIHANLRDSDVEPRMEKLQRVANGLAYVHAEIRRSHDQVGALYRLEKEQRFDAANHNPRPIGFAATRLADAASVLRDLWYEAYRSSGRD